MSGLQDVALLVLFVACVLWVIEGQLKKRVRVIWSLRNTVGRGGLDSCGGV